MLRGPQTLGELRGRASRMQPFESLETVKNLLEGLRTREEPIVRQLPPLPGSRAERYANLFHRRPSPRQGFEQPKWLCELAPAGQAISLSERVTHLEAEVREMRQVIQKFAQTLGEPDPFAGTEFASPLTEGKVSALISCSISFRQRCVLDSDIPEPWFGLAVLRPEVACSACHRGPCPL